MNKEVHTAVFINQKEEEEPPGTTPGKVPDKNCMKGLQKKLESLKHIEP